MASMSTGRPLLALTAAAVAVPLALVAGVVMAAEGSGALTPAGPAPLTNCVSATGNAAAATLTASQEANARIIYDVAASMNLPQQAAVIAIATAMQESRLQNLPHGDADSIGLFQQRPSKGWGTPAQLKSPVYAATAFYDALVQVPGWQALPLTVAAQDVQHSAYPGAYAQWQNFAAMVVAKFSGTASDCLDDNGTGAPASGSTGLPAGFSLPADTPQAVQIAIGYAAGQLGKPYIWGGTGPDGYDCSGLVMMAYRAAGIDLPRTTFQQVLAGTAVYSLSQLQPGDLLFTAGSDGTAADPGHVGMFVGSGLVISAPQTGEPVMVTPLAGYWASQTVAIRRVA
jgi:cell wall-associated NlpC family hydrolase